MCVFTVRTWWDTVSCHQSTTGYVVSGTFGCCVVLTYYIIHLTFLGLVAHKVAVHCLHLTLTLAICLASFQVFHPSSHFSPTFFKLFSHIVFGRPTFLLPSDVHVRAVRQWLSSPILRMCLCRAVRQWLSSPILRICLCYSRQAVAVFTHSQDMSVLEPSGSGCLHPFSGCVYVRAVRQWLSSPILRICPC